MKKFAAPIASIMPSSITFAVIIAPYEVVKRSPHERTYIPASVAPLLTTIATDTIATLENALSTCARLCAGACTTHSSTYNKAPAHVPTASWCSSVSAAAAPRPSSRDHEWLVATDAAQTSRTQPTGNTTDGGRTVSDAISTRAAMITTTLDTTKLAPSTGIRGSPVVSITA